MKNFNAVFTTKRLALVACFLAGWLLMAGISAYYDLG
jgi:hypothetical protein